MLLAIDIGNTNILLGIYVERQLKRYWRIHTNRLATADEYAVILRQLLAASGLAERAIRGVAIVSVVPSVTIVFERMVRHYWHLEPLVVGPGVKTGLNIKAENPKEIGTDRIVTAVAANHLYSGPSIVVDFGTATTFGLVNDREQYLGGLIAPGLGISTEALVNQADQLAKFEVVKPTHLLGKNTIKAMQSGVYYGYIGLVDGIVHRLQELASNEATVVATGGLAELIYADTETIDEHRPLLILEGLRLIYERNVS
ncbi:type III pantothenate kinase [Numidum massiliense]|uniref:type III pantothenate kinase n=1 Tax=Numidum massiliense TaxID=1522315 RepID=UPI0006D5496E|nr:type III pantothenate kinase [Numidum massiliense]